MGFLDDLAGKDLSTPPSEEVKAPAEPTGGFLESLDQDTKTKAAISEKTPDWSQVPTQALVNAPKSAWNFAKNMVQPVIHPIDTLEGIGNLALGVMEKAGLYGHAGYEKHADAVGKALMDRYGSVDNIKKTLAHDPVGVAGDLSAVLTGGGSLAARVPGMLGKVGEVANVTGRVIDPLNAVTAPVKLAGKIGTEALGHQTGLGSETIKEMAGSGYEGGARGETFRDNMRDNVPMEQVVADARGALGNLRKERGNEYKAGMSGVAANQTVIPNAAWGDITQAMMDAGAIKSFKGQEILPPKTAALRDQLNNTVIDWMQLDPKEFHTAEGMDALKQKLDGIRKTTEFGSPERVIANKYYGAVRKAIVDHVPEYAKVMEGYEKASGVLSEIERTLSLPAEKGPVSIDTSLRKLQSVLRNNVNSNYGYRQTLVDYLEHAGAPNLKAALAGQGANTFSPRGLSKVSAILGAEGVAALAGAWFSGPAALAAAPLALAASSPRIVGEAVHGASRVAGVVGKPLSYLVNKPIARTAQEIGRYAQPYMGPNLGPLQEQARGGAVERALRTTQRYR